MTGFSRTKVNRCLAEGRERFRAFLTRSESGGRCAELRPVLSAFCDGEASAEETSALREHLRVCAHCRAAMRAYRAAPGRGRRPRSPADRRPAAARARPRGPRRAAGEAAGTRRGPDRDVDLPAGGDRRRPRHRHRRPRESAGDLRRHRWRRRRVCVSAGVVPAPSGLGASTAAPPHIERVAGPPQPRPEPSRRSRPPGPRPSPPPTRRRPRRARETAPARLPLSAEAAVPAGSAPPLRPPPPRPRRAPSRTDHCRHPRPGSSGLTSAPAPPPPSPPPRPSHALPATGARLPSPAGRLESSTETAGARRTASRCAGPTPLADPPIVAAHYLVRSPRAR